MCVSSIARASSAPPAVDPCDPLVVGGDAPAVHLGHPSVWGVCWKKVWKVPATLVPKTSNDSKFLTYGKVFYELCLQMWGRALSGEGSSPSSFDFWKA